MTNISELYANAAASWLKRYNRFKSKPETPTEYLEYLLEKHCSYKVKAEEAVR